MISNLYRYAFPVPRQGRFKPFTLYIRSGHNPRTREIVTLINREKVKARKSNNFQRINDLEAARYAVSNVIATSEDGNPELPCLPVNGMSSIPVLCQTLLGGSVIQISLIEEHELNNDLQLI